MKKMHTHKILEVLPFSPCEAAGVAAGDVLLAMNGEPVQDVLDYHFQEESERLTLTVEHPDGSREDVSIEKDEDEELGLVFAESLMDNYQSCRNKCMFCFIDQMPPGMRKTLYFKDDDTRLSFLQGNYVTLTNLSDAEIERICYYKLSPMNISVHTTNPALRCEMLKNRFAGNVLGCLKRFQEAGITMNGQVVLVKGKNDGEELERTIHDLTAFLPQMQSLSVVPVGLTKYREGLPQIEPFSPEDARTVLAQIHKWQGICKQYFDTRFVFASDEWYILAGEELPDEESYEGYPQIENGVGMLRSLTDEVTEALRYVHGDGRVRTGTIATGVLATPYIRRLVEQVREHFPGISVEVTTIVNHFFGERITVSGLLTGGDIIAQLRGRELGGRLFLPENLLRSGEDVLLDDLTVGDIEKALQTKVTIVQSSGQAFIDALLEE